MPYVKIEIREALTADPRPETAGELNYIITTAVLEYLSRRIVNYEVLNSVIGALESAKLEFYRRVVAPYEEQKRFENGDVYPHTPNYSDWKTATYEDTIAKQLKEPA